MKWTVYDQYPPVPREQCDCKFVGIDEIHNPMWDKCLRCETREIMIKRGRRRFFWLLLSYLIVYLGSIIFEVGVRNGWWG